MNDDRFRFVSIGARFLNPYDNYYGELLTKLITLSSVCINGTLVCTLFSPLPLVKRAWGRFVSWKDLNSD